VHENSHHNYTAWKTPRYSSSSTTNNQQPRTTNNHQPRTTDHRPPTTNQQPPPPPRDCHTATNDRSCFGRTSISDHGCGYCRPDIVGKSDPNVTERAPAVHSRSIPSGLQTSKANAKAYAKANTKANTNAKANAGIILIITIVIVDSTSIFAC